VISGVNWEFEVIFSPKALKHLKLVDKQAQIRIKEAIEILAHYPPKGDVVRLKGSQSQLRLRVGDWRVTFEYDFSHKEVHILTVKHRREVYR